jgi:hypothetical protein
MRSSAKHRFGHAGRALRQLIALAAACFLPACAFAQPVPKITSITPEWVQRGTSTEVTIVGENLSGVTDFIFSGTTGLTATNLPPAAAQPSKISIESSSGSITRSEVAAPKDDKRLVVRLTATGEARAGARELRVSAPGGVSNPVELNVGYLPELAEKGPNNSIEQAQTMTFPVTVAGVIAGAGQTDYYKFKASKGQELIFDVDAFRRGSPLDSTLAILDGNGKELARSEDVNGFDSFITFNVPADGDYFAQIRDFRFQGSGAHKYRLSAGELPYVESIFPLGGQRGKQVEVALAGHNLEGTAKMNFDVAPTSPLGRQEIRANTPKGYSNPISFDVSDFPDFLEAEPNDTAEKANSINVPVVINGKIGAPKDVDRFKFKVGSDQRLVCEGLASRYGSPLDVLLVLEDSKGAVLQQNDDAAGADARIEFDAKKDTEYVVAIRDLTSRGGDTFAYRLAVRPPSAAAEGSFVVRFTPDAARLHRGGTTRMLCELKRSGYDGPVKIFFQDLPVGVFAEPVILTGAPSSGLITLSASSAAPLGNFRVKLAASGIIGGKTVARTAEALLNDKPVREAFLTVLDTPPFTIYPITLSQEIEQNRSENVEVMVQRREGFTGEIKLSAEGYVTGKEGIGKSFSVTEATVKPAEMTGRIKLTAKQDSEIGTRTIVIKGESVADGQPAVEYSHEIPVTIRPIPFIISSTLPKLTVTALPPGSESAAAEASTTIKVERRDGFTNELQLTAKGIPEGIQTTLEKIGANAGETTLKVVATEKAKAGTNTFTVLATGVHNDRNYRFRTSPVTLVVNLPEATERPPAPVSVVTNVAANAVSPAPSATTK